MPEGPIILLLKDAVEQFKGQTVIAASCNNKTLDTGLLIGRRITGFKSWGKHFLICFPKFTVRIHLMMFGSYRINEHTGKPPRLHLQFAGGELNFYAVLLKLIDRPLDDVYDWSADVMAPEWDTRKAIKKMKVIPKLLACDALMDQQLFSGVGNIIKNEVLFRIRVHPESMVSAMPAKKVKEMIDEAVKYSFEFLAQKKQGTLNKHWLAYNKKTCPRDDITFHKQNTGRSRRTSFYCDKCMVMYYGEQ